MCVHALTLTTAKELKKVTKNSHIGRSGRGWDQLAVNNSVVGGSRKSKNMNDALDFQLFMALQRLHTRISDLFFSN